MLNAKAAQIENIEKYFEKKQFKWQKRLVHIFGIILNEIPNNTERTTGLTIMIIILRVMTIMRDLSIVFLTYGVPDNKMITSRV